MGRTAERWRFTSTTPSAPGRALCKGMGLLPPCVGLRPCPARRLRTWTSSSARSQLRSCRAPAGRSH
eukprot:6947984-Pyramimonas_sp.AAC.1